jgi:hypothetical protein
VLRELSLADPCGETEREAVDDGEDDADAATEAVATYEWLAFALWETLPEPLRVTLREAVGVTETETDADTDGEPEPVAAPLPLTLRVQLLLGEALPARESDAFPERVTDGMVLGEGVPMLLSLAVPCGETETEAEADREPTSTDAVATAEGLADTLWETLLEPLRVTSREAVGETEAVAVTVCVPAQVVGMPEPEVECVLEALCVMVAEEELVEK